MYVYVCVYVHIYIYMYTYIYIYVYIYITSKSDLLILAALRLQEFKGSIFISTPAVAQIVVNIYRTSFPSPNGTRTELTPKFLDRSTPNSVLRLFHTLEIIGIQGSHVKSNIIRTYTSEC